MQVVWLLLESTQKFATKSQEKPRSDSRAPKTWRIHAPWISDCPSYYGMAVDPVSGEVYASVTDYSTFGLVEIRSESGELLGQFDCGVSPGVICMDVRELSSIAGSPLPIPARHRLQRVDVLGRALPNAGRLQGLTLDGQGRKSDCFGSELNGLVRLDQKAKEAQAAAEGQLLPRGNRINLAPQQLDVGAQEGQ